MATPPFKNLFDPDLLASSTFDFALPDLGGPLKPSSTSPVFRDNALATLDFNITPRRNRNAKSTTPHQFMIAPDSPLAASFYKTPKKPDSIAIADELDLTLDDVLASPFNTGLLKHKLPNGAPHVRRGTNGRVVPSFDDENRLEQPEKLDTASVTNAKRPLDITLDTGDHQEIDRLLSESSSRFEERQDSQLAAAAPTRAQAASLALPSSLVVTPATSFSPSSALSLPMGPSLELESSFNLQSSQPDNADVFGLGSFDEVFITETDLKKAQEKLPDDEVKTHEDTLLKLTQSLLTLSEPSETDEDTVTSFEHVQLCNNFVTLGTGTFTLTPTSIIWRGNLVGLDSTLPKILRYPITVLSDVRAKIIPDGQTQPMMLLTVKERVFVQIVFGEGREDEPVRCARDIRAKREEQQSLVDVGSLIRMDGAMGDANSANSTKTTSTSTTTVASISQPSAARPSLIPKPSTSISSTTYSSNSAQGSWRSKLLSQAKSNLPQPKHTIPPKATTARSITSALKKPILAKAGASSLASFAEGSRRSFLPLLARSTGGAVPTTSAKRSGLVGMRSTKKEDAGENRSSWMVEPSLLAKTRREMGRSSGSKREREGSLRGASNKENESVILDVVSVVAANTTTETGDKDIGSEDKDFRLALSEAKRKRDEMIRMVEMEYHEAVEQLTSEMRQRKKRRMNVDVDTGEKGVTDRGPTTAASLAITTAESNVLLPPRATASALTTGTGLVMSEESPAECQLCYAEKESRVFRPCGHRICGTCTGKLYEIGGTSCPWDRMKIMKIDAVEL